VSELRRISAIVVDRIIGLGRSPRIGSAFRRTSPLARRADKRGEARIARKHHVVRSARRLRQVVGVDEQADELEGRRGCGGRNGISVRFIWASGRSGVPAGFIGHASPGSLQATLPTGGLGSLGGRKREVETIARRKYFCESACWFGNWAPGCVDGVLPMNRKGVAAAAHMV